MLSLSYDDVVPRFSDPILGSCLERIVLRDNASRTHSMSHFAVFLRMSIYRKICFSYSSKSEVLFQLVRQNRHRKSGLFSFITRRRCVSFGKNNSLSSFIGKLIKGKLTAQGQSDSSVYLKALSVVL